MPKQKEISVLDYADKTKLDVVEIYRLIDKGTIKTIIRKKKTFILL